MSYKERKTHIIYGLSTGPPENLQCTTIVEIKLDQLEPTYLLIMGWKKLHQKADFLKYLVPLC